MQLPHYQTKHPRGSSPHQETGRGVGHRLERPRPRTQSLKGTLITRDEPGLQKPVGQQEDLAVKITTEELHPRWYWDGAGRWI